MMKKDAVRWGSLVLGRGLLEREPARRALEETVHGAAEGHGGGVWLEGVPGVGKSALLHEATTLAEKSGLGVLRTRAIDALQGFSFGMAWSLLAAAATPAARQEARLVHQGGGVDFRSLKPTTKEAPLDPLTALHRLTAQVLDHTASHALALVIDDVHWADTSSLRWLVYLAQRLDGLPVAVIAAARMREARTDTALLRQLASQPAFRRIRLGPLGSAAIQQLVRSIYPDASPSFCDTCANLTGGNPFLLTRLLATAKHAGVPATPDASKLLADCVFEGVLDHVQARIDRLDHPAQAVVEAVAVLGDGAEVAEIAELCATDVSRILRAVDDLAGLDILADELPVSFLHPLVGAAVTQGIGAGRRANLHRSAAAVLSARGASISRVASHLCETAPAADPWVVEQLRASAGMALAEGAPWSAVKHLRRALHEPPPREALIDVCVEVAEAEAAVGDDGAFAHLELALEIAPDSLTRARLWNRLGWMFYRAGRWHDAYRAFDAGRGIETGDDTLTAELSVAHLGVGALVGRLELSQIERKIDDLAHRHSPAASAQRDVQIQLAVTQVFTCGDHLRARALAQRALDEGRMLNEQGISFSYSVAVSVLFWSDALDEALDELRRAVELARDRGDPAVLAYALFGRAQPRFWRGDVVGAAADATSAVDLWRGGWNTNTSMANYWQICALLELDDLVAADAARIEPEAGWSNAHRAVASAAQGRLALAHGDTSAARTCFDRCAELAADVPFLRNPMGYPWRADAAMAALLAGQEVEADHLAAWNLDAARSFGAPRAIAAALRLQAAVGDPADRLDLLTDAHRIVLTSPSLLEQCRTLLDLGAELRRRGQRSESRVPLRKGLDIARRHGLVALERRAFDELSASGARPRQRDVTGPGALTPTERRIADLAAEGRTNREIAHLLFVNRKTVEWHLGHVYTKLQVRGRRDLAEALKGK